MRTSSIVALAFAGAAIGFAGWPQAHAMTPTSLAGVRAAAEAIDDSAAIACRCIHRTVVGTEEEGMRFRHRNHRVVEGEYGKSVRSHTVRREEGSVESRKTTGGTGKTMTKAGQSTGKQGTTEAATGGKGEKGMGRAQGGGTPMPGTNQSGSKPGEQKQ